MKNNNEILTGLSLVIDMKDKFNYEDFGKAFAALPSDEIKDKTRVDMTNEIKNLLSSMGREVHESRMIKILVHTARMKTKEEIINFLKTQ